ncbi:MAG TPA: hemolysin family protein [Acidobacteriaceae bacterium]|jgi:CBS domain containing-hemolysin-like protein|nr:hemolysin family protein [Acidobacteriaceae bacterium]
MSGAFSAAIFCLLCLLALAAYADDIYIAMGRFLPRENTENLEAWERWVEPRLRLSRESAGMSASVLRQIALGALVFLLAMRLHGRVGRGPAEIARTVFELLLVLVFFDRLIPQLLVTRTRGRWVAKVSVLFQVLFYVVLPVTLLIGLLLSIVGLAEPEAAAQEHPGEAVDALLEAGEEEGILEESDRELVRSVVEFGDMVVREVMTPRPEIFAVRGTMPLAEFERKIRKQGFSRVPVYRGSLDEVLGIAFARDLLDVKDADAERRTVGQLARPALFVPESKKVNELLREMQRQKQHMSIVIDEYGNVAGLATIEDLLEAIVGEIEDEHDTTAAEDAPVAEEGGTYLVPGSFEVSRLRELFAELAEPAETAASEAAEAEDGAEMETREQEIPQLLTGYEATTLGGLVSEIAGHIPLPGEVVADGPLRMEVVASTDRRVERVRVGLAEMRTKEPGS